ncbi:hypothetical protein PCE1_003851 [Barthelona sp. PCE]
MGRSKGPQKPIYRPKLDRNLNMEKNLRRNAQKRATTHHKKVTTVKDSLNDEIHTIMVYLIILVIGIVLWYILIGFPNAPDPSDVIGELFSSFFSRKKGIIEKVVEEATSDL